MRRKLAVALLVSCCPAQSLRRPLATRQASGHANGRYTAIPSTVGTSRRHDVLAFYKSAEMMQRKLPCLEASTNALIAPGPETRGRSKERPLAEYYFCKHLIFDMSSRSSLFIPRATHSSALKFLQGSGSFIPVSSPGLRLGGEDVIECCAGTGHRCPCQWIDVREYMDNESPQTRLHALHADG